MESDSSKAGAEDGQLLLECSYFAQFLTQSEHTAGRATMTRLMGWIWEQSSIFCVDFLTLLLKFVFHVERMFVFSSDFEMYAARNFTSSCAYTSKICKEQFFSWVGCWATEFGLETFPHVRYPSRTTLETLSVTLQFQAFTKVWCIL